MLIRANRNAVFNAFAHKDQLCKFWLDHASADLAVGANVEWHFMVPGAKEKVNVTRFVQDEQITFKWSDGLLVDMQFSDYEHGQTLASVVVTRFKGKDACSQAIGATEGFAIVLCDLKTLLEAGSSGRMVKDKAQLIADSQTKSDTK